ncbi:hypothetical protein ASG17_12405 [Brevundimonas sp. Leaf363]|uniref:DUF6468 domain-containing protein n=1 Tax=Brevundimonas sp. Leaf363 TaxID=1736353 RepID=UPI0007010E52|nr:DUF6468 domain-containing protein [Brevundimonas sp. Leaf363]KQS54425.1 hypothetical protein ASG17_12405 [Brevundimonas sp. Leaf363]
MTGVILDCVLMLLLVAALGYGVRLERKLTALREGQVAFAGAVSELNTAAARAEAALGSLRASGQETDLLHDRIVKARAVKAELEALMHRAETARGPLPPLHGEGRSRSDRGGEVLITPATHSALDALSSPTRASAAPSPSLPTRGRENSLLNPEQVERFTPVLQALAANQAAKESLNRARRSLDDDLFAA